MEHEDVKSQKWFLSLFYVTFVGLKRSTHGQWTMGLYKKEVLEESKAV